MARQQRITHKVNALAGQMRFILHLECKHAASVPAIAFEADPNTLKQIEEAETWMCQYCPDPPPPTPEDTQRAKSAAQLYREAGEPDVSW